MRKKKVLALLIAVLLMFTVYPAAQAETSDGHDGHDHGVTFDEWIEANEPYLNEEDIIVLEKQLAIQDEYVRSQFEADASEPYFTDGVLREFQGKLSAEQYQTLRTALEDGCNHVVGDAFISGGAINGPNASYCRWQDVTTTYSCELCGEMLSHSTSTYYIHHTFIAIPPNIQICSRCGYS